VPSGRRWGGLVPSASSGCRLVEDRPLRPVWPLWRRGRSPGPVLATVGAWPVPCTSSSHRWGVAGPLGPVWRRGVVNLPLGHLWPPWRRGRSFGPHLSTVGACPVPYVRSGRRGGVPGPLDPVWLPWGRGRSSWPCLAAVGAWPVPWTPSGRRLVPDCSLGPVSPP